MAFWNKPGNQPDPAAVSSQQMLERGGLPLLAQRRIKAENDSPKRRFTSDLSVNELLLTHAAGYVPVSQVVGSCVYHVGWQFTPTYSSSELSTLTHAYSHARLLALSRLQQEAHLLGAHGVVGVRIERQAYDWAGDLIEFIAVGTAIRLPNAAGGEKPFLSDLSGREFWALHEAGYHPVGVAFGNCVWYEVASWSTQVANNQQSVFGFTTSYFNQELTDFTQAVYNARHLATRRMEAECQVFGGSGIVGVKIATNVEEREVEFNDQKRTDMVVTFESLGTAITEYRRGPFPSIDYTMMLKDLPAGA